MKRQLSYQAGFSLVELLIAMTIALVALTAGSAMYVTTKQTNRVQQMQDQITQDGRFVMHMLQQVISQAGFRDNPGNAMATNYISLGATPDQSMTVRFFSDSSVSAVACDGSLSAGNGAQALTIGRNGSCLQCSTGGGTPSCPKAANDSTTFDWIAPASAGTGNGTELVSFQLLYGTDTGPTVAASIGCGADVVTNVTKARDCIPDIWTAAAAAATPAQVVAVKACFVLRSERADASITRSANVLDCAGAGIVNSQTDNRLYRTFRTTILLRNR